MQLWNKNEINILRQHYGRMHLCDLQNRYLNHRTIDAILYKAKQLKLRTYRRRYYCDFDFFNFPNEINSYCAGFIAADGYVNSDRGLVQICLSDIDVDYAKEVCYG